MKTLPFDEAQLVPLVTDSEIQSRVEHLIGRAEVRQLWLLFLGEDQTQLQVMIPIGGLPPRPSADDVDLVLDSVHELMGELGARSIIVVHERFASSTLNAADVEWARSVRAGCRATGLILRAQLLSHRGGVRWIADDDL